MSVCISIYFHTWNDLIMCTIHKNYDWEGREGIDYSATKPLRFDYSGM